MPIEISMNFGAAPIAAMSLMFAVTAFRPTCSQSVLLVFRKCVPSTSMSVVSTSTCLDELE